MQKATTSELKVTNQKHVLSFIYKVHKTSKSELADKLGYSRPTINQCLKDLEDYETEEIKIVTKKDFQIPKEFIKITFCSLSLVSPKDSINALSSGCIALAILDLIIP